jgi:hypothetical protein
VDGAGGCGMASAAGAGGLGVSADDVVAGGVEGAQGGDGEVWGAEEG